MIFLYLPVVLEGKPQRCRPPTSLDCSEITFPHSTDRQSLVLHLSVSRSLPSVAPSICMTKTFKHGYRFFGGFFWGVDVSSNAAAAAPKPRHS